MGSSCEVSAAAHFPKGVAVGLGLPTGVRVDDGLTALRLEGIPVSVSYRRRQLESMLRAFGVLETLDADASRAFWRGVRDVRPFADGSRRAVWRISVAPTDGPKVGAALQGSTRADVYYDWAGGLIWAEMPTAIAEEAAVRAAVDGRGHALLVRADPAVRASAHVFEPLNPSLAALSKRLKESFDPKGILNPGRIHAGL
jgi:glycolate oxidase FAD binding subunit